MIKLKASYIIAGVIIVSAAASPFATYAKTGAKHLNTFSKPRIHLASADLKTKHMVAGTVTAMSGSSITVAGVDGTTYAVDASSAKLFTMMGVAGLTLANVRVGDKVTVMGKVTGTNVAAKGVTDLSFLGRNVFMGMVTAISGSNITIDSLVNKTKTTYTINASAATIKKGVGKGAPTAMTVADVLVGDRITAVGVLSGTTVAASAVTDMGAKIKAKKMVKTMVPKPIMQANIHSGTVTAINGSVLTIDSFFGKTKTTFTVDASSAAISKGVGKSTKIAVTDIAVGDKIMVSGPQTGTNITATTIRDLGIRKASEKRGN